MSQQFTRFEMLAPLDSENNPSAREDLIQSVSKYAQADYRKAFWQISNTFVLYIGLWALMIFLYYTVFLIG
jgi:omega-6 fatty acid desaturase (delta-12 desaturase)